MAAFTAPALRSLVRHSPASNASGLVVTGSFTGLRDNTAQPANLTLTNMTQQQLFYTQFGYNSVGQLNWQNAETFTFGTPTSDLNSGQFTINDKVAGGDPNFTTYRKTLAGTFDTQDVTLRLYKPGPANTELALSYATFGQWSTVIHSGMNSSPVDLFFFLRAGDASAITLRQDRFGALSRGRPWHRVERQHWPARSTGRYLAV